MLSCSVHDGVEWKHYAGVSFKVTPETEWVAVVIDEGEYSLYAVEGPEDWQAVKRLVVDMGANEPVITIFQRAAKVVCLVS